MLTLEETFGIGKGEVADQLQGSLCEGTQTCVKVDYPATIGGNSLGPGVIALDDAISSTPGQIIVFGYSQGALVAGHWLTEHAAEPDAPSPAEFSLVLIGNPARKYGGAYVPLGDLTPETQYQVSDIAREYDFFADFPNKPSSLFYLLAVANTVIGIPFVHLNYTGVDPEDPANAVWTEGNTTYTLVPTQNVPLLAPLRLIGLDGLADALNAPVKSLVDRAYDRPVPLPTTTRSGTSTPPTEVVAAAQLSETTPAADPVPAPDLQTVAAAPEKADDPSESPADEEAPAATTPTDDADEPTPVKKFRPFAERPRLADIVEAKRSATAPTAHPSRKVTLNGDRARTGKVFGHKRERASATPEA